MPASERKATMDSTQRRKECLRMNLCGFALIFLAFRSQVAAGSNNEMIPSQPTGCDWEVPRRTDRGTAVLESAWLERLQGTRTVAPRPDRW